MSVEQEEKMGNLRKLANEVTDLSWALVEWLAQRPKGEAMAVQAMATLAVAIALTRREADDVGIPGRQKFVENLAHFAGLTAEALTRCLDEISGRPSEPSANEVADAVADEVARRCT